jgi:hypothetical protein
MPHLQGGERHMIMIQRVAEALVGGGVVGLVAGTLLVSIVTGTSTSDVLLRNTIPTAAGGATALLTFLKLFLRGV